MLEAEIGWVGFGVGGNWVVGLEACRTVVVVCRIELALVELRAQYREFVSH